MGALARRVEEAEDAGYGRGRRDQRLEDEAKEERLHDELRRSENRTRELEHQRRVREGEGQQLGIPRPPG